MRHPFNPGFITAGFGYPGDRSRWHNGVDYGGAAGARAGVPVPASGAGTVTVSDKTAAGGNRIRIDHGGGISTWYLHLQDDSRIANGSRVAEGQIIGLVGSTGNSKGPHLHFELHIDGVAVDPVAYLASTAGGSITPTPLEDDMYDQNAQQALYAKIEAESRPYRTYQYGTGLLLIGPGGRQWAIPSQAYQTLLVALGLTSATVQRVIPGPEELTFLRGLHGLLSPDPANDAAVDKALSLSEEDVHRIASAIPDPQIVLSEGQVQQITEAARSGAADGVKSLSFVTVAS